MLRRLTGMEMGDYMWLRLTGPLGFGAWGYAMYRPRLKSGMDSAGRMLLHEGKWGDTQIVPAEFVRLCGRMVKYNPHYTHSINFNVNEDGHIAGAPKDVYRKAGSGGYSIYVIRSLDTVIYSTIPG